jgi:hypothetical protein
VFSIFVVMDDELSPTGKSRELVLGIFVQHALAEVEPINCHPPVIEIDTSSSYAADKAFKTRDELIEWAREVKVRNRDCEFHLRCG